MMKFHQIFSATILVLGVMLNYSCIGGTWDAENQQNIQPALNPVKSDLQVDIPRIDYISLSPVQPCETDSNVIWTDDFDEKKQYMQSKGDLDKNMFFGENGASMIAGFKKGDVEGEGNRKLAFGDFPQKTISYKNNKKFDEIYFRLYVKHEYGWEGAPAKLARATSIVSDNWAQAMIAHVWSGSENSLNLDPARGVLDQTDQISTTQYNDFAKLKWLGNKPNSNFQISATGESGYWVMVEMRAKLNTPGKSDGINQLWIDGRLEVERTNLNFRGSYSKHGINAVFLESHWNSGSLKDQGRWFDNFVVSTQPIGPVVCPANPTLYKTTYKGPKELENWEVELASDFEGKDVVFQSKKLGKTENVKIKSGNGNFSGSLQGHSSLSSGKIYFCRVRQKSMTGEQSEWSRWHQGFKVE